MRAWTSATIALAACAAVSRAPAPAPVQVPAQPPQPVSSSPRAGPPASAAPPSRPFRCEGGLRFEAGARAYCAYADPLTWEGAEGRCVENGGHLVTIDARAVSDALRGALGSPMARGRAVWMGLELDTRASRRVWRWGNGEPATDVAWDEGEPNDDGGNEGCGEWLVATGSFNDTRCDLRLSYLCQGRGACADGRAFAAGGIDYCYRSTPRSFADARRACAKAGGALATPRRPGDQASLREAMAARFPATRMWIGLSDAEEEGTFAWASGAPAGYRAWLEGEPNDFEDEDCVELHSDTWAWNDRDCGAELPSVCESPLE